MFDFKFTQRKRYILIASGRSVISKTQRIVVSEIHPLHYPLHR